jgi:hypothetical protein
VHDFPEYHIDRELYIGHFRGSDLRDPTLHLTKEISSVDSNLWDFCILSEDCIAERYIGLGGMGL